MISNAPSPQQIEAILFDVNGTLRKRVPDPEWQQENQERLSNLLAIPEVTPLFLDELTRRYKTYTRWADEHQASLPEAEIWAGWLTPDLSPAQIAPMAAELMLAFRSCRGRHILKPDAMPVIRELNRRGYRLGVISNTTSTLDIPRFIDENELAGYFDVVILSSQFRVRKPAPEIFWQAARVLGIDPSRCAYLGNKPANDVIGPRRAGFGMAVMVNNGDNIPAFEPGEEPDRIVHELVEILDIFPG
jgi:HAD superfamily hydrolase (TIGR01549 family)